MDLMFIVQVVLSLFAILFTYDSICGEREAGTLKLNFANPIPRTSYIISKIVGSWLGLSIPLIIPMLLGLALVLVCGIPRTVRFGSSFNNHWCICQSTSVFLYALCNVFIHLQSPSSSFLYLLLYG
jgi:ABC-type Na+ efflux pump permease subunit